jgi:hypothetical protein
MIAETSGPLDDRSLQGVITTTLAPACAALSNAVSIALERSQALRQIVRPFGTIVEKNDEPTLEMPGVVVGSGVCRHAASTGGAAVGDALAEADADAVGEAEDDADAEDEAVGDAPGDVDGDGDGLGSGDPVYSAKYTGAAAPGSIE